MEAIRRKCAGWLLSHRRLFDAQTGSIDEARVTVACELALLTRLLSRSPIKAQPEIKSNVHVLQRCIDRWNKSLSVQTLLSSGPVEAWSGSVALTIASGAGVDHISRMTERRLFMVSVDRQLEWSWWCMQIAADPWRERVEQLSRGILFNCLSKRAHRSSRGAYRLTHAIFYGTDFGRVELLLQTGIRNDLRIVLHEILIEQSYNFDLLAEVLMCFCCLGWHTSPDSKLALKILVEAQLPDGVFAKGDELAVYHPCIVLSLTAVVP